MKTIINADNQKSLQFAQKIVQEEVEFENLLEESVEEQLKHNNHKVAQEEESGFVISVYPPKEKIGNQIKRLKTDAENIRSIANDAAQGFATSEEGIDFLVKIIFKEKWESYFENSLSLIKIFHQSTPPYFLALQCIGYALENHQISEIDNALEKLSKSRQDLIKRYQRIVEISQVKNAEIQEQLKYLTALYGKDINKSTIQPLIQTCMMALCYLDSDKTFLTDNVALIEKIICKKIMIKSSGSYWYDHAYETSAIVVRERMCRAILYAISKHGVLINNEIINHLLPSLLSTANLFFEMGPERDRVVKKIQLKPKKIEYAYFSKKTSKGYCIAGEDFNYLIDGALDNNIDAMNALFNAIVKNRQTFSPEIKRKVSKLIRKLKKNIKNPDAEIAKSAMYLLLSLVRLKNIELSQNEMERITKQISLDVNLMSKTAESYLQRERTFCLLMHINQENGFDDLYVKYVDEQFDNLRMEVCQILFVHYLNLRKIKGSDPVLEKQISDIVKPLMQSKNSSLKKIALNLYDLLEGDLIEKLDQLLKVMHHKDERLEALKSIKKNLQQDFNSDDEMLAKLVKLGNEIRDNKSELQALDIIIECFYLILHNNHENEEWIKNRINKEIIEFLFKIKINQNQYYLCKILSLMTSLKVKLVGETQTLLEENLKAINFENIESEYKLNTALAILQSIAGNVHVLSEHTINWLMKKIILQSKLNKNAEEAEMHHCLLLVSKNTFINNFNSDHINSILKLLVEYKDERSDIMAVILSHIIKKADKNIAPFPISFLLDHHENELTDKQFFQILSTYIQKGYKIEEQALEKIIHIMKSHHYMMEDNPIAIMFNRYTEMNAITQNIFDSLFLLLMIDVPYRPIIMTAVKNALKNNYKLRFTEFSKEVLEAYFLEESLKGEAEIAMYKSLRYLSKQNGLEFKVVENIVKNITKEHLTKLIIPILKILYKKGNTQTREDLVSLLLEQLDTIFHLKTLTCLSEFLSISPLQIRATTKLLFNFCDLLKESEDSRLRSHISHVIRRINSNGLPTSITDVIHQENMANHFTDSQLDEMLQQENTVTLNLIDRLFSYWRQSRVQLQHQKIFTIFENLVNHKQYFQQVHLNQLLEMGVDNSHGGNKDKIKILLCKILSYLPARSLNFTLCSNIEKFIMDTDKQEISLSANNLKALSELNKYGHKLSESTLILISNTFLNKDLNKETELQLASQITSENIDSEILKEAIAKISVELFINLLKTSTQFDTVKNLLAILENLGIENEITKTRRYELAFTKGNNIEKLDILQKCHQEGLYLQVMDPSLIETIKNKQIDTTIGVLRYLFAVPGTIRISISQQLFVTILDSFSWVNYTNVLSFYEKFNFQLFPVEVLESLYQALMSTNDFQIFEGVRKLLEIQNEHLIDNPIVKSISQTLQLIKLIYENRLDVETLIQHWKLIPVFARMRAFSLINYNIIKIDLANYLVEKLPIMKYLTWDRILTIKDKLNDSNFVNVIYYFINTENVSIEQHEKIIDILIQIAISQHRNKELFDKLLRILLRLAELNFPISASQWMKLEEGLPLNHFISSCILLSYQLRHFQNNPQIIFSKTRSFHFIADCDEWFNQDKIEVLNAESLTNPGLLISYFQFYRYTEKRFSASTKDEINNVIFITKRDSRETAHNIQSLLIALKNHHQDKWDDVLRLYLAFFDKTDLPPNDAVKTLVFLFMDTKKLIHFLTEMSICPSTDLQMMKKYWLTSIIENLLSSLRISVDFCTLKLNSIINKLVESETDNTLVHFVLTNIKITSLDELVDYLKPLNLSEVNQALYQIFIEIKMAAGQGHIQLATIKEKITKTQCKELFNDDSQTQQIIETLFNQGYTGLKFYHFLEKLKNREVVIDDVRMIIRCLYDHHVSSQDFNNILEGLNQVEEGESILTAISTYCLSINFANVSTLKKRKALWDEFLGMPANTDKIRVDELSALFSDTSIYQGKKYYFKNPDLDFQNLPFTQRPVQQWDKENIREWAQIFILKKIDKLEGDILLDVLAIIQRAVNVYYKQLEPNNSIELRPTQILTILTMLHVKQYKNLKGCLSEVATGEGKTILIACYAIIHALRGKFVNIPTSSSLLAKGALKEFEPLFSIFGLSAMHNIQEDDGKIGVKPFYESTVKIVYGDSPTFECDYLYDRFYQRKTLGEKVNKENEVVIIDEVDHVLYSEANYVTMISENSVGMESLVTLMVVIWNEFQNQLSVFKKNNNIQDMDNDLLLFIPKALDQIKEQVYHIISEQINNGSHFVPAFLLPYANFQLKNWIDNVYLASNQLHEKFDYLILPDAKKILRIKPVAVRTNGITQQNMQWNNGLHQFLQIKHGLAITPEGLITNFISHPCYFSEYGEIYGLSGTLGSDVIKQFYFDTYQVETVAIPTFKEKQHYLYPEIICHEADYFETIRKSVFRETCSGRSVLVICESVEQAEKLEELLKPDHITVKKYFRSDISEHANLEKRLDSKEVMISTNLGGRGMDIILSPLSVENGGLHTILTVMPDSMNVLSQALGRSSRQGQPGTGQLILNEVTLLERFQTINLDEIYQRIRDLEIENIKAINIDEQRKKHSYFISFCDLLKELPELDMVSKKSRDIPLRSYYQEKHLKETKLIAVKQAWGMWLQMHADQSKDDEALDKFIRLVKKQYTKDKIITNPFLWINYANKLITVLTSSWKYQFNMIADTRKSIYKSIEDACKAVENKNPIAFCQAQHIRIYALFALKHADYKHTILRLIDETKTFIKGSQIPYLDKLIENTVLTFQQNDSEKSVEEIFHSPLISQIQHLQQMVLTQLEKISDIENAIYRSLKRVKIHAKNSLPAFYERSEAMRKYAFNLRKTYRIDFLDTRIVLDSRIVIQNEPQIIFKFADDNATPNNPIPIILRFKKLSESQLTDLLPKKDLDDSLKNLLPALRLSDLNLEQVKSLHTNQLRQFITKIKMIIPILPATEMFRLQFHNVPLSTHKNLTDEFIQYKFTGETTFTQLLKLIDDEVQRAYYLLDLMHFEVSCKLIDIPRIHNLLTMGFEYYKLVFRALNETNALKLLNDKPENTESLVISLKIKGEEVIRKALSLNIREAEFLVPQVTSINQFFREDMFHDPLMYIHGLGLQYLFVAEEKYPLRVFTISLVTLAAVSQILTGVSLMVFSGGFAANIGLNFLSDGILDILQIKRIAETGKFSWTAYGIQKLISVLSSVAFSGLSKAGGIVTETAVDGATTIVSSASKEAKNGVVLLLKNVIGSAATKKVVVHAAKTVVIELATHAINTLSPHVFFNLVKDLPENVTTRLSMLFSQNPAFLNLLSQVLYLDSVMKRNVMYQVLVESAEKSLIDATNSLSSKIDPMKGTTYFVDAFYNQFLHHIKNLHQFSLSLWLREYLMTKDVTLSRATLITESLQNLLAHDTEDAIYPPYHINLLKLETLLKAVNVSDSEKMIIMDIFKQLQSNNEFITQRPIQSLERHCNLILTNKILSIMQSRFALARTAASVTVSQLISVAANRIQPSNIASVNSGSTKFVLNVVYPILLKGAGFIAERGLFALTNTKSNLDLELADIDQQSVQPLQVNQPVIVDSKVPSLRNPTFYRHLRRILKIDPTATLADHYNFMLLSIVFEDVFISLEQNSFSTQQAVDTFKSGLKKMSGFFHLHFSLLTNVNQKQHSQNQEEAPKEQELLPAMMQSPELLYVLRSHASRLPLLAKLSNFPVKLGNLTVHTVSMPILFSPGAVLDQEGLQDLSIIFFNERAVDLIVRLSQQHFSATPDYFSMIRDVMSLLIIEPQLIKFLSSKSQAINRYLSTLPVCRVPLIKMQVDFFTAFLGCLRNFADLFQVIHDHFANVKSLTIQHALLMINGLNEESKQALFNFLLHNDFYSGISSQQFFTTFSPYFVDQLPFFKACLELVMLFINQVNHSQFVTTDLIALVNFCFDNPEFVGQLLIIFENHQVPFQKMIYFYLDSMPAMRALLRSITLDTMVILLHVVIADRRFIPDCYRVFKERSIDAMKSFVENIFKSSAINAQVYNILREYFKRDYVSEFALTRQSLTNAFALNRAHPVTEPINFYDRLTQFLEPEDVVNFLEDVHQRRFFDFYQFPQNLSFKTCLFSDIQFVGTEFHSMDLFLSRFNRCYFAGVSMQNVNLSFAKFLNTTLDVTLKNVTLDNVSIDILAFQGLRSHFYNNNLPLVDIHFLGNFSLADFSELQLIHPDFKAMVAYFDCNFTKTFISRPEFADPMIERHLILHNDSYRHAYFDLPLNKRAGGNLSISDSALINNFIGELMQQSAEFGIEWAASAAELAEKLLWNAFTALKAEYEQVSIFELFSNRKDNLLGEVNKPRLDRSLFRFFDNRASVDMFGSKQIAEINDPADLQKEISQALLCEAQSEIYIRNKLGMNFNVKE